MGQLIKGALSLIGMGGGAPKASTAPAQQLNKDIGQVNDGEAAMYATGGGGAGEELTSGQVKKRNTIFGN
jgi:hypothetical protein